ncbi:MAG: TolC family protein [Elusimicrobiaceae bacterium]|nr:TolC family protein [Elusimicrobiaceae bacterium]
MKKLTFLCLALLLALPAVAQKEYGLRFSSLINDELTLENAIRIGLENNNDFLLAQQEVIVAEQKVKQAKFLFLPQFSLQGTATWYDLDYPMVLPESVANRLIPNNDALETGDKHQFFGVGVTGTQYLYSGGRIRGALKMAEANLKQVQSKYESVKNAVVLDIKKSFFQLLYAQYLLELSHQVDLKAQTFARSLNVSSWDKIKAQYALSKLLSLKNIATNELQKAQLSMLVSLNKELNSPVKVKGDFSPIEMKLDLATLNLWSMEFRPELKTAIYALELDNLAIDLALSHRYPDLVLTGSYERLGAENLDDENKQISLAVKLPLPYNVSSQTSQRKAEQKQSTLRRAAIEDKIRVQVAENYANFLFWQKEVPIHQNTWQEVQKLLAQNQQTSRVNLNALEALEAYFHSGKDYYQSILHNLTSKASLEWAIGRDL